MEISSKDTDQTGTDCRMVSQASSQAFRSQLVPIFYLTSIFFLNFMARIILAPLIPVIEKDLGISHGEAGSLFLYLSSGYCISLMGSGFFSSRLTHRRTIILSAAAVGVALLGIAFSDSLKGIRIALLLVGIAAGIYLPSGIATLTALISRRHWGKAIAIHALAPNISYMAAPIVSEALLVFFSWRGVLAILGLTSMLTGIAFTRFGEGGKFLGQAPTFRALRTLFSEPLFWINLVMFSLGVAATVGVYSMLPLYLVNEQGIDRYWANTLIAFSRGAAISMVFVAGWANDRFGLRWILRVIFIFTGVTTVLLGTTTGSWLVIMVFLQPIAATCYFPPGYAAVSSIGPASARNLIVSLMATVGFFLGGGVIPAGIGLMGDAGYFGLSFIMVGTLMFVGYFLTLFLKPQANVSQTTDSSDN